MTIKWSLRMVCAERNIWRPIELQKLLEDKTGLKYTHKSVNQLLTGEPKEIKISTLNALCNALDCTPQQILFHEAETTISGLKEVAQMGGNNRKDRSSIKISKPPL